MLPVADVDLGKLLASPSEDSHPLLRSAFGCLSTALAFLHSNQIRHKDIKPQNILIDRKNLLLTDFGISYDFSAIGISETSSFGEGTLKYASREAIEHGRKGRKAD